MIVLGIIFFIALPLLALAWIAWVFAQECRRDRIPILLYHRLIRHADASRGHLADEEMIYASYDTVFEQQMAWLHDAGHTALDMDDYVAIREGRRPPPPKPLVITFDDGYLSNYTLAYPALRKYGHKAVIYVAPEPDEETRRLVEGLDAFLNPDQMRELSANGVSIQSHTLTHCVLSELDDRAIEFELTESRRRLAEITGRPVDHLAVPRSGGSRRVRQWIEKVGYRTSCGNGKGSATASSDIFDLPRIVIERDMTIDDFAAALTPRSAAVLRIVGNIKRIPERLGGARFADAVRARLYTGRRATLFKTRNLKAALAVLAVAYLAGSVAFTYWLLQTWQRT